MRLKKLLRAHYRLVIWLTVSASAALGGGLVACLLQRPMNWDPAIIIAVILGGITLMDYFHK